MSQNSFKQILFDSFFNKNTEDGKLELNVLFTIVINAAWLQQRRCFLNISIRMTLW